MTIFLLFFQRLRQAIQRYRQSQLIQIVGLLVGLIIIGAVGYRLLEGWSTLDSLYATVITITTVGYGDLTPTTQGGRIFAIGFTLIGISLGGYAISTFAVYAIATRERKRARRFRERLMDKIHHFNQHYILCGANLIGTRIAEEFKQHNVDFVIIDNDEENMKRALLYAHPDYFQQKVQTLIDFHEVDLSEYEDLDLPELSERVGIPYFLADPTDDDILLKAGIDRAQGLIAVEEDDRDNLSIVIGARSLAQRGGNTNLRIMANVSDPRNMRKMYLAGAHFVRTPSIITGVEMASHIMYPEIGKWWYSQVGVNREKTGVFQQVTVDANHPWLGKTVSDVHRLHQTVIIGIKQGEKFNSPPAFDLTLQAGNVAIFMK